MRARDEERILDFLRRKIGPDTYAIVELNFRNGSLKTSSAKESEVYDEEAPKVPEKGRNPNGNHH